MPGAARAKAVLLAIVVAGACGVSDEWHQAFVPLRSSDVLDWVADTVGSILGAGVLPLQRWLARNPAEPTR